MNPSKCLKYTALFSLLVGTQMVVAKEPTLQVRMDKALERAISEQQVVGAVALVAQDGKVVYSRAIGFADREAKRPMQKNTIFRLASMTKPIVSVTALSLVDQGKLSLDDSVTKWLPDFQPRLADGSTPVMTIRHLLTHTSGLDYGFLQKPDGVYRQLKISDGIDRPAVSLDENLQRLNGAPLLFAPGTRWHYSLATDVLGAVVAKASEMTLLDAVSQSVSTPLSIKDTGFVVKNNARLSTPYAANESELIRMNDPFSLVFGEGTIIYSPSRITDAKVYPSGGAGMAGTANDYLSFLEALRKGTLLKPETNRLFSENAIADLPVDLRGEGWGFGLGVSVLKDAKAAGTSMKNGAWSWEGVYGTYFWVDPTEKLSVVILTNTVRTDDVFIKEMTNAVYGI